MFTSFKKCKIILTELFPTTRNGIKTIGVSTTIKISFKYKISLKTFFIPIVFITLKIAVPVYFTYTFIHIRICNGNNLTNLVCTSMSSFQPFLCFSSVIYILTKLLHTVTTQVPRYQYKVPQYT